jgi:PAS domain S-box-containing protein
LRPAAPALDLPVALVVYDSDGIVVDATEAACELLGLPLEQLIGSSAEASGWSPAAGGGGSSAHPATAAIRERRTVKGALARVRRADGSDVWIQADVSPLTSAGDDGHVIAALADVTELVTTQSARAAGQRIVDHVTEVLAGARFDPEAILTSVTRALARLRPGIWVAAVMGKDPEVMQIVAGDDAGSDMSAYIDAMRRSGAVTTTPITTRVIESGEPLLLPQVSMPALHSLLNDDVRHYIGVHPAPNQATHLGVLVVPMRARGAIIGTLGLFERPGSSLLGEADVAWMQAVADRTGLAVANAQLHDDAVQRLDRLAALQEVSLAVSASPDLRLTLKVILDHVTARLKVDAADVLLLDESDNSLALASSTGFRLTAVADYRLPADEGIPGRALVSRRIETVTALSAFSQFRRRSMFAREGFKAYGAVPLVARGRLLGALEVFHRSPLNPDQEWTAFLDALGSVASMAIDSATLQDRLRPGRDASPPTRRTPPPQMSAVEARIFRMAVDGLTNREIAEGVHLSANTVKFHMRKILQKSGAANRTELASLAVKERWV